MATGEISEFEDLIRIPSHLLLNLEIVRNDPIFRPIYEETPELHDGLGGLAVYLIHESLNESSFWRPYLCSLPKFVPLPVFYSPQKRSALYSQGLLSNRTGGRPYFDKLLRSIHWIIDSKFSRIMPALLRARPDRFPPAAFTRPRWAWAMSIILSRTWGRPFEDALMANHTGRNASTVHTLVPAADMPNHDAAARPAQFRRDAAGRPVLALQTNRPVGPAQQVYISYGPKCDIEFLINCQPPLPDTPPHPSRVAGAASSPPGRPRGACAGCAADRGGVRVSE
jgi:hypothetical protein